MEAVGGEVRGVGWGWGERKPICCQHKNVPLVGLMHLVFTRMPGESYRGRRRSLLWRSCVAAFEC